MSGNVDEWVYRDRTWGEWRSALKGRVRHGDPAQAVQ